MLDRWEVAHLDSPGVDSWDKVLNSSPDKCFGEGRMSLEGTPQVKDMSGNLLRGMLSVGDMMSAQVGSLCNGMKTMCGCEKSVTTHCTGTVATTPGLIEVLATRTTGTSC